MSSTEYIDALCYLMGLQLQEEPSIEINTKSAPRRLIGQLVRQKYIPSYQTAPDDLKWLVKGEGDCQPVTSIHIIDLLGIYDSRKNKIIIYDLLIKLCSVQLKFDYEGLKAIVMLHELSHAITHRGVDSKGQIWEYFDIAVMDVKEHFAQIYTYKQILQDGNDLLLDIMNELSKAQPSIYQSYKSVKDHNIEKINKDLLEARLIVPSGFETYPEAVNRHWEVIFNNLQKFREPYSWEVGPNPLPLDFMHPPPRKLVTKGTEFRIIAGKIKIRSYDYSPSSDELPSVSTCEIYKSISMHEGDVKKKALSNKTDMPFFNIIIDGTGHYLDLKDPFVFGLWKEIVTIISKTYPALGKVLTGYGKEF